MCPLNDSLNSEDAIYIYRESLSPLSSIYFNTLNNRFTRTKICIVHLRV
jgi:hypothetical protein